MFILVTILPILYVCILKFVGVSYVCTCVCFSTWHTEAFQGIQ